MAMFNSATMFNCGYVLLITLTILVKESHQFMFESVNNIYNLYDGVQCSLQIVEVFINEYNRPICCIYWKVKQFFEWRAQGQCETPDNLKHLLSGQTLKDYVDFSHMDCSRYPEDSPDCDRLWRIVLTIAIGQLLLFIFLLITSIILACLLCRHRRNKHQQEKIMKSKLKEVMSESYSSSTISEQIIDCDSDCENNRSLKTLIDGNHVKDSSIQNNHDNKPNRKLMANNTNNSFEDDEDDILDVKNNQEEHHSFIYPSSTLSNGYRVFVSNNGRLNSHHHHFDPNIV